MKRKYYCLSLLTLLLTASLVHAGETGTTVKADSLRDAPFSDAKVITTVSASTPIEILKKNKGWYQITTPQGKGWMRMLSIRRGDAKQSGKGNQLTGLASLTSGRAGTGKVVSTTGVRGLNEEELKAAKFDEKQIALAESYLSSRDEAQKYAARGKLKSQQINYLPEPAQGGAK